MRRPHFPIFVLGVITGLIVIEASWSWGISWLFVLSAVSFAIGIISETRWRILYSILGGFLLSSLLVGTIQKVPNCHNQWGARKLKRGIVEGTVAAFPRSHPRGLIIELNELSLDGAELSNKHISMRLFIPNPKRPEKKIQFGDGIKIFTELSCYPPPQYPNGPKLKEQMNRQRILFRAVADEKPEKKRQSLSASDRIFRFVGGIRHNVRTVILQNTPSASRGPPMALILGNRSFLSPKTAFTFRKTGISHLFAISGFHFGLLIGVIWFVIGKILELSPSLLRRWGKRPVCLVAALGISFIFLIVIGIPISAKRAWLGACFAGLTLMMSRKISGLRLVSIVALIILIIDPFALFRIGFQLSFTATAGMIVFYQYHFQIDADFQSNQSSFIQRLQQFTGITAAANISTWPILIAHTGQAPIGSILLNLFVIPVFMVSIFPSVIVGTILSTVISFSGLFEIASRLTRVCRDFAKYLATFDWYFWTPGLQSPLWVMGLTVAVMFLLTSYFRAKLIAFALCIFVGLSITPTIKDRIDEKSQSTIHFLPIGQGDATVIESANGEVGLIDAGGSRLGKNPGRWQVIPYLTKKGIEKLDWVVATHSDIDHIGGLSPVFEWIRVNRLYYPAISHSNKVANLLETAHPALDDLFPITPGDFTDINKSNTARAPPPIYSDHSDNNQSIIVRTQIAGFEALFPGDIEAPMELTLLSDGLAGVNLLKAPHHGSSTSSRPRFISQLSPNWTVFSAGRDNPFGHPAPKVVKRYQARGAKTYRTGRHGLIQFEIADDGDVSIRLYRP